MLNPFSNTLESIYVYKSTEMFSDSQLEVHHPLSVCVVKRVCAPDEKVTTSGWLNCFLKCTRSVPIRFATRIYNTLASAICHRVHKFFISPINSLTKYTESTV